MWSRLEVDPADTPLGELGMVGRSQQPEAVREHLPAHVHPMYEIVYFVSGRVRWWAAEDSYDLHAGDVFVTRPDEPHGAIDESLEPCDICWLQVDLAAEQPLGFTPDEVAALTATLDGPSRVAVPNRVIGAHFDQLLTECLRGEARRTYVKAHCVAILGLTAEALDEDRNPSVLPAELVSSMLWMRSNIHHRVHVADCAAVTDITEGRLFALFRRELNTTPNEWLTRQRVDEARKRLDAGDTISSVAFDLGFSSTQYFATVFKRYSGHTPSGYQRRTPG